MGRWAQYRRRGGGGVGATTAASIYITSVVKVAGDSVQIHWSNVVNTSVGVVSNGAFNVAGNDSIFITTITPTITQVQMESAVIAGDPWNLTGQPPWVNSPAVVAGSGVVL